MFENFDWSSVFTDGRIKAQIQEEDPNAGRLPRQTLQLISACAALLLRALVQESTKHQFVSGKGFKENRIKSSKGAVLEESAQILVLSAKDILQSIQNKENLAFLLEAVEQATMADDGKLARQHKRTHKGEAHSDKMQSKKRKVGSSTEGTIDDDAFGQALQISKEQNSTNYVTEKITIDEEEYD